LDTATEAAANRILVPAVAPSHASIARPVDTADLADAIRSRRAVELVYGSDEAGGSRVVLPHALYRTTSGGLCLDGVQVGGRSSSGGLPAWKQFHLMRITSVRVLESRFDPAPDFDPDAPKYRTGLIASARR
jgi:hypothetical protein